MMRTFVLVAAIGVVLSSSAGLAVADTVHLHNGSAIDCLVIGRRDDMIVLMIGNLGRMTIPERDVKVIEKNSRTGYVSSDRGGATNPKSTTSGLDPTGKPKTSDEAATADAATTVVNADLTEEEKKELGELTFELTRQDARKRTRAERKLLDYGPKAIPSLLPIAKNESDWTRAAVFRIFKANGEFEVTEACVAALLDPNRWVRKLAWETLLRVSGRDYYFPWDDAASEAERVSAQSKWQKWWDLEKRKREEAATDADAIRKAEREKGSKSQTPPANPSGT
ncbi:MAG: hypothetical protein AB7O52_02335 [Planctomycetota bacterium]